MEGTGKDLKGRAKEAAGSVTKDRDLKREGKADQAEGSLQKGVGDVKKSFGK